MSIDWQTCAERAAAATIAEPPRDDRIITKDEMCAVGSFPPLRKTATADEHKAWQLAWMQYTDRWRKLVLAGLGRWPATVHGVGFRVLAPGENVPHAEEALARELRRAIRKARRIAKQTDASVLTSQQAAERTDFLNRTRQLQQSIRENTRPPVTEAGADATGTAPTPPWAKVG